MQPGTSTSGPEAVGNRHGWSLISDNFDINTTDRANYQFNCCFPPKKYIPEKKEMEEKRVRIITKITYIRHFDVDHKTHPDSNSLGHLLRRPLHWLLLLLLVVHRLLLLLLLLYRLLLLLLHRLLLHRLLLYRLLLHRPCIRHLHGFLISRHKHVCRLALPITHLHLLLTQGARAAAAVSKAVADAGARQVVSIPDFVTLARAVVAAAESTNALYNLWVSSGRMMDG